MTPYPNLTPAQDARIKELTDHLAVTWQGWLTQHGPAMVAEGQGAARRQLVRAWHAHSGSVLALIAKLNGWTIPGEEVQACLIGLQASAKLILAYGEDLWVPPDPREEDG